MPTGKKTPSGNAGKPKPKTKTKKKKSKFSAGKALMFTFIAAVLALICALGVYIFIIINGEKLLKENINKLDMDEASHIYDNSGNEVATLMKENREIVKPEEIPQKLKEAFVATEDRRFGQHSGIDFLGIGRALVKDVVARSAVEGGSTITQQLAKNVFLTADKTFFRKATEMSIAVALENNYSKDEILTMYMNRIFFGNRSFGIKVAAKKYFNVSDLSKLKLWQMATLAAIPKAPSTYNPISNPEKSKERRSVVLRLMQDQGYITEAERLEAEAVEYTPPEVPKTSSNDYLTYLDYVLEEANDMYGLSEDDVLTNGYKIYTTMDATAQKVMEQTFANDKFFQKDGPEQKMQGAMAIVNNEDGGLIGIIGGRDYVARGLDRATIPQQPGSSIKPIVVYAPAIESGKYTPYSMLQDKQVSYSGYSPRNYDGVYQGQVTMFDAVKRSINAPAIWLLNEITVKKGMDFAINMGIPLDPVKDRNLAIALGGLTNGATPLQMATAYAAFANNGYLNKAHAITKILDDKGQEVYTFKQERKSVMSPKTAYYMTQLMEGVVGPGGTGASARFDRPLAGKTGSTQNVIKGLEKYNRDLWFTGYTPEWSAAVWIGFDKADAKHYVTMSSGAPAVIFKEVMQKALANKPMTQFTKPDNVPELGAPPKTAADLKAEYVKDTRSVLLNWSSAGDNISYQIFRKEDKDKDFPSEPMLTTSVTEVRDITVKPGTTYQYVVVPLNTESGTAGAQSNAASVTVPADSGADGVAPGQPGQNGQNGQGGQQGQNGQNPGGQQGGQGQNGQQGAGGGANGQPGQGQGGKQGQTGGAGSSGNGGTGAPSPGNSGGQQGQGQGSPNGSQPGGQQSKPGGSNNGGAAGSGTGSTGAGSGAGTTDPGTAPGGGTGGGSAAPGTGSGSGAAPGGTPRARQRRRRGRRAPPRRATPPAAARRPAMRLRGEPQAQAARVRASCRTDKTSKGTWRFC
ncbi:Penicillin-binding protein 1F [Paenibacillus konkukensis]|uniref:Penicillin-binding protein 1F n=1 Tax=Paenibacillus konkukensis TaxID=2020716 RepID=A0ABY4RHN4_9BACL|nr:penicillin-binding protein 1A [Paenibacillus konkukensis]UQZ81677.1 Penicillin-binding protein 1F [Paenibacillus konkukensis]